MTYFEEKVFQNSRIMVFPFDLLAHYLRSMVLVEKHASNCEVYFQSSKNYNSYLVDKHYHLFKCESFDAQQVMTCAKKFDFSWLNFNDISTIYYAQLEVIKNVNPDIVIGDTSPTLKMAAEKLGVRYYSLKNNYLSNNYAFPRKLSITHPGHKHLIKLPVNFADRITTFIEKIAFKQVQKPFKKLRKEENLKTINSYIQETEGDITIYCDDEEIFPLVKKCHTDIVIHPLLYDPNKNETKIIRSIQNGKPTICVTMGSSGDWDSLSFLNNPEYSIYNIITGGDKQNVICANNTFSSTFLSLKEVLPFSDLLICHGGNGTIYHGVFNKVFTLCLTSHFEQEWNVQALERKKLGASINQMDESEIHQLIKRQINTKWNNQYSPPKKT